jgi:hypothetical protein
VAFRIYLLFSNVVTRLWKWKDKNKASNIIMLLALFLILMREKETWRRAILAGGNPPTIVAAVAFHL